MKKIINILILFLICNSTFAQFNVIVEDSTNNHLFKQLIIENNNEFTIINGSGDSLGNRGISIIRADSTGNIVWEKLYSKNNENWYEGYNYSYNKDLHILSGSSFSDRGRASLILFDNNYDTIYYNVLILDTLQSANYSVTKSYDNNIITSGQIEMATGTFDGSIIKYNINGDTIWTRTFGDNSTDLLGKKIIETNDSSLISIGSTYSYSGAIFKQDWYIVKTDSLGNLDWWLHPGNPQLNDGAAQDIIQTKDSCFIVVGGKAVYNDNADSPKFDGRIMKLDINGTVLWDKTYRKRLYNNQDSLYCLFSSIVELDDGGFAVVSQEQVDNGYGHRYNRLYRFNSDGDTISSTGFSTYLKYGGNNYPTEYLTTIQKTENGGFLMGGWGTFEFMFSHPYTQQMILVKTDSLGCDGTEFSCPTVAVPSIVAAKEIDIVLYPNPATNSLTLALSKGEGINKNTSIFVYDVYGRCVITYGEGSAVANTVKQSLSDSHEQSSRYDMIIIDISSLQTGVYFVRVGESVAKFVKE